MTVFPDEEFHRIFQLLMVDELVGTEEGEKTCHVVSHQRLRRASDVVVIEHVEGDAVVEQAFVGMGESPLPLARCEERQEMVLRREERVELLHVGVLPFGVFLLTFRCTTAVRLG